MSEKHLATSRVRDSLFEISITEVEFARQMVNDLSPLYDDTNIDKVIRPRLYDFGINFSEHETKFRMLTDYLHRLDNQLQEIIEALDEQWEREKAENAPCAAGEPEYKAHCLRLLNRDFFNKAGYQRIYKFIARLATCAEYSKDTPEKEAAHE